MRKVAERGSKETYLKGETKSKNNSLCSKKKVLGRRFKNLRSVEEKNLIFKEARKMKNQNQDIDEEKSLQSFKLFWLVI